MALFLYKLQHLFSTWYNLLNKQQEAPIPEITVNVKHYSYPRLWPFTYFFIMANFIK